MLSLIHSNTSKIFNNNPQHLAAMAKKHNIVSHSAPLRRRWHVASSPRGKPYNKHYSYYIHKATSYSILSPASSATREWVGKGATTTLEGRLANIGFEREERLIRLVLHASGCGTNEKHMFVLELSEGRTLGKET
jgi:hypothetical protein